MPRPSAGPAAVGTDWRVHFSVNLADLQCDFFQVTDAHGGETFRRIPVAARRFVAGGPLLRHTARHRPRRRGRRARPGAGQPQGLAAVRHRRGNRSGWSSNCGRRRWDSPAVADRRPPRPTRLSGAVGGGQTRPLVGLLWSGGRCGSGRPRSKRQLSRTALFLAGYFFVWTDVPAAALDAAAVLAWYRCRWQIELCFKRMKSILGLGDLPKRREDSCRAWLHGKLLVALLLERLLDNAEHFSPWGYELATATQSLA